MYASESSGSVEAAEVAEIGGQVREEAEEVSSSSSLSSSASGQTALELAYLTRNLEKDIKQKIQVKQLKREFRGQLLEMVVYCVFLVVFSLVVLNSRDPLYSFQYNDYMKDLMLYEEFSGDVTKIYKTFFSVATFEEFWQYMKGPLLAGLFESPDVGLGRGYIYGVNYLVGAVRLRQVRVAPGKCDIVTDFKAVFPQCYARYSSSAVERGPHTPKLKPYFSSDQLGTTRQVARLQWFEGGGYIEDFSIADNTTVHEEHMAELESDGWVDLQTRVVWVDFTTYNANLNLFHIAQMAFEFLPSGGVFPSYTFRVARLYKYADTALGRAQLAGEIIIMFFVVCYLIQEVYELWKHGCIAYWQNGWNVIDLVNMLLFVCVFGIRIAILIKLNNLEVDPTNTRKFYNFQPISLLNSAEQNILAVNAFILWFKVFKYTKFLPGMDIIAETVSKSIRNTVSFVAMMAFVLFGFAQAGVLAFGTDVPGFHTFIDTFFTLLRSLLGDFDFVAMQESNRVFGPLYFVVFIVLVFFILLSMFMAILNDAYTEVQDTIREKQKDKVNLLHVFGSWIKDRTQVFQQEEDDAQELQDAIVEGDQDDNDLLDRDEIETIFKKYKREAKQLLGVNNAEELLREFDTDGDNLLDVEEQRNLLRNLQQRKLQAQVKKHELHATGDISGPPAVLDGDKLDSEFSSYIMSLKRDLSHFHERLSKMDKHMRILMREIAPASGSSSSSSSSS
ncbi:polycystic kidney disease 2 [Thecamonas trahens ATCC 50062]|uniref:Polycystic kidney disease 2 n=1 Tax=Thecamonas trahens ATCC 50062 TaxID=461836 RepID=A0A0L0DI24_THETB|nr:polycystic kidney disease 2 [Thecamonas trahens ATCC 50062]KNC51890.1 polycystic kidney disease 2 [Thecamonas trahens ATCC 50062]|eukprot:XP_013755747.1 polycystic kidney disease 2 [Thecamonas trahens ATCC 50062]